MTTQVASAWSRRFAALYPLLTPAYRSCFVDDDELRETVHGLTDATARDGERVCTLLGTNRPLGDVWRERAAEGLFGRLLTAVAYLLSLLLVGRVISLVYGQIARRRPSWRAWRVDALEPQSFAELLALYNPWNRRHVALAGYNTGVTHFGWKYPGKTVVKTTGCARLVRVHGDAVDVDAGVTIKRVSAELARAGRQPYVVPNYSYVTLGTTFFVPIHGSGSDVSTLGDTIEKVVFYDPSTDRLHAVRRGDPAFDRTMYDLESGVLVLRLRLRVRPQTRYFMRRCLIESPTADDVWECFTDPTAANIEMRKPSASSTAVRLAKFYTAADGADDLLEVPRDSIGRLWDRLEENRLTSALFHGLTRRYAFHVELFLDRDEFEIFWQAHAGLPLLKIQLRFVHHDGLPNSPFGDRDCIAADLFMRRSASPAFLRFVHEKLPHARFNRGKHGM